MDCVEKTCEHGGFHTASAPEGKKIIPVARWNFSKERIDEMTRYLDAIKFTFQKAFPNQQLMLREFKKMAIAVEFTLKYCLLEEDPPVGKGYTAIQVHHWNTKTSMNNDLFHLAMSYKLMNPVPGITPGSPFCTCAGNDHES